MKDIVEYYAELMVQFGYIVLFASLFPLAPLLALLNNVLVQKNEIRAFCTVFIRPYPERLGSIGFWMSVWEFLALVSVVTNGLLIYYLSSNIEMIQWNGPLDQL